jgi:triacylglycerol lipase
MNEDRTWKSLLKPGDGTDFFASPPATPLSPGLDYDPSNSWWLAEISRLIYRVGPGENGFRSLPLGPRGTFLSRGHLKETRFVDGTLAQVSIIVPESQDPPPFKVVVFRGTHNLQDVLTDVNVEQAPMDSIPSTRVHAGFLEAFESIWSSIRPEIVDTTCPIFFTGHSLGAALATLALAAAPGRNRMLYTFGSPRVGDPAFAKSLKGACIHRVVNHKDIVPAAPPDPVPDGARYEHVGTEIRLVSGRSWLASTKAGLISGYGLLRLGFFVVLGQWHKAILKPPERLSDHAPLNYVLRLKQQLPSPPIASAKGIPGHRRAELIAGGRLGGGRDAGRAPGTAS